MNPGENASFEERLLHAMNNRPDEDIVGTPEWTEKVFRLADERDAAAKRRLSIIRNGSLGLLAVSAAVFGVNDIAHLFPAAISTGTMAAGGGSGLGTAIGAQLNIRHF